MGEVALHPKAFPQEIDVKVAKDSIDLGIVVSDAVKALAFYRDALGLEQVGEQPTGGAGKMYRLQCGATHLKVIHFDDPRRAGAPGWSDGSAGPALSDDSRARYQGSARAAGNEGHQALHADHRNPPGSENRDGQRPGRQHGRVFAAVIASTAGWIRIRE